MTPNPDQQDDPRPPAPEVSDLYRKLEERAIAESNDLNRRVVACRQCRRGDFLPTVGSGHPLADIILVKYQPRYLEVSEGVAFFGRSGSAVLKSMERLGVNPLLLYGTNLVKCADVDLDQAEANCPVVLAGGVPHHPAQLVVVMGEATLDVLNEHSVAGMSKLTWDPGSSRSSRRSARPW